MRLPGAAATRRPARAMSAASPTVFMSTVLPPALGPLTIRTRAAGPPRAISLATTALLAPDSAWASASRGWRASFKSTIGSATMEIAVPPYATPSRAAAASASSSASTPAVLRRTGATTATSAVSASRIRRDSRRMSSSTTFSRLLADTSAVGSMNTVSPVRDVSWTIPSPSDLADALSGNTNRSARTVKNWS